VESPVPTAQWRSKVWPHQADALDVVRRFLRARSRADGGAALLHMPTGTGKTGVIAISAQQLATSGHVLVLSPWDALVAQLERDLGGRFWDRIGVARPANRPVTRLLPSNADTVLSAARRGETFVCTITTLRMLFGKHRASYDRLARAVAFVMVDEGHYEPALDWAEAVRGLGKPVVLLTATPYRNDYKFFDVDRAFLYSYSHERAERDRFIRAVAFESQTFGGVAQFCTKLVSFYKATYDDDSRVIVRCNSKDSVIQVTKALAARGESVIGIHERLDNTDLLLRRTVPSPDADDAPTFWVHQFKLVEGIDDPRFRLLAMFEPFGNERQLVQQVGRILRNPKQQAHQVGRVFTNPAYKLEDSWRAYRAYDRAFKPEAFAGPREFARTQPSQYVERRFREPFDLDAGGLAADFNFPRATQAFLVPPNLTLDAIVRAIEGEWDEADLEMAATQSPDHTTRLHAYISIQNSPLLLRKGFPEYQLGVTLYRRVRQYVFYFDSQGRTPEVLSKTQRVSAPALERLYAGNDARVTSVSLRNTSLGRHDVRRRLVQAYSIGELAPDLGDHTNFASTATGLTRAPGGGATQLVSRYVGFTKARVRDRAGAVTGWDDYKAWLDQLADQLDNQHARPPSLFDRFAEIVAAPANARAANILLDFEQDLFVESTGISARSAALELDELCVDVGPTGVFHLRANGRPYELTITWQPDTGTYHLSGAAIERDYGMRDTRGRTRASSLLAFLNHEQAFRVIPRGGDYSVYARGRFYRPRVPLWGQVEAGRLDLIRILHPIEQLATISLEKGADHSATPGGWAAGSLFNLIDHLGIGTALAEHFAGTTILVCDDMGSETADFIALMPNRVIAIHAKAFAEPHPLSASALSDVTAQAVKNLGSFQPYIVRKPASVTRWNGPWVGPAGTVTRRIRRGGVDADTLWRRIRAALRNPNDIRETWIVLGQGLSRTQLEAALAHPHPAPQVIQLLFSLQSTWSSASAVGSKLRVFCSP
jgi:superfamily II DNA or RNA helicase